MRNCLIVSNKANYVCKAYDSGRMTFENCTFADNCLDGTFLNFTGSAENANAAEAVNCIFTRNYDKTGTTRCDFKLSGGTNVTLSNCLVGTSRSGTPISESGTVTANDVKFNEGSATDPYEIKRTSPAIGKGQVLAWMTAEATDFRGKSEYPRLRDGVCDIGCDQCWIDPVGFILLYK